MGLYDYNNTKNNKSLPPQKDYNGYAWLDAKNFAENLKKPFSESIFGEKRPVVIDGKLNEMHFQERTGDCYAIAASNSISYTPEGQKAIKEQIFKDPLSGMIGVKLNDTGKTYYFTEDDIRNAETQSNVDEASTKKGEYVFGYKFKESGRLSSGDPDLVAIELAYEQFRVEKMLEMIDVAGGEENYKAFVAQMKEAREKDDFLDSVNTLNTLEQDNQKLFSLYMINQSNGLMIDDTKNPLDGGLSGEFTKTFLGDKVKITEINNMKPYTDLNPVVSDKKEESGDISSICVQQPTSGIEVFPIGQSNQLAKTAPAGLLQPVKISDLPQITQSEEPKITSTFDLIKSISDYGNPKTDSITVTFSEHKGEMYTNHVFSYKGEDNDFVTLVNPLRGDLSEIKIPKEEFYGNIKNITVVNYKNNSDKSE